jgi:hypothetical protein
MFGFSADLSWTDHNDQVNKEKVEQQNQRQRAESRATHLSDTSSVRSIKTRTTTTSDGHRYKPKFSLFRKNSRASDGQRDIHSSAGSYMTNWTNGWSVASTEGPRTPPPMSPQSPPVSMAISPPRPAPNQFARHPFVPPPFSSPYGYSAFAECKQSDYLMNVILTSL